MILNTDIDNYNKSQAPEDRKICDTLANEISKTLFDAESKIWHAHPVWFLDGNPIVGYSRLKNGVRLMFWSGADFGEMELTPGTGKFKDASITYTNSREIKKESLHRWLGKSRNIQWDYKNIIKRKGKLLRLTLHILF